MGLSDRDWDTLIKRIRQDQCTPFLGSELSFPSLPKRSDLASDLAIAGGYPFEDTDNLARVAQYLATQPDKYAALELVVERLRPAVQPDFNKDGEPHAILARLPFSVYMTTAYEDYMFQALRAAKPIPRAPRLDYCRWYEDLVDSATTSDPHSPDAANPLVFHLHGTLRKPDSLVLTEDDYLDYLINTSSAITRSYDSNAPQNAIPTTALRAFGKSSLLFLGYRMDDLEFRVLLRTITRRHNIGQRFCVQVIQANGEGAAPSEEERKKTEDRLLRVREFLTKYCRVPFGIEVHWVKVQDFLIELDERYHQSEGGSGLPGGTEPGERNTPLVGASSANPGGGGC